MRLLGVDVGGTFTDIFYNDTDSKETYIHKTPTTTEDPSIGVLTGIEELAKLYNVDIQETDYIFHGTTIGTNAILEFDGAKTGLITTKNYRDITHIGRHQRPENYSIMQDIPWQATPLVKRRYRKTVTERMGPERGEVITPLDEDEVIEVIKELKEAEVESIIVGFLFSYINPEHEQRVVELIEEIYPTAFITSSHDISPQFREFERFTTASINGFIGPKVKNYIDNLAKELKSFSNSNLHIMTSNGGVGTPKNVAEQPVNTLVSGPAAGVLGGAFAGELSERKNLITFDMGGTSADIGIISDSSINEALARDTWIAGFPVMVPMIDIHTIGAGGGSIAYTDDGGLFRVGPRSAGSNPGPACYGRGGTEPTVSDANVVLGRLDGDNFLGGEMEFFEEKSLKSMDNLTTELGMSREDVAEGIVRIVNNNMANAIREKTVQQGIDPREYSLVAFGGAGPMHAIEIAKELNIREVIVPEFPGINSATGLLTTDLKYDVIQTEFMMSDNLDLSVLNKDIQLLEEELEQQLLEDNLQQEQIVLERYADCRYIGQGYELRVPVPAGKLTIDKMQEVFDNYHDMHHQEYGHSHRGANIEIVNIRVTGIGKVPKLKGRKINSSNKLEDALVKESDVIFREKGETRKVKTPFYRREELPVNKPFSGPAIILQKDTTTIVPPNTEIKLEAYGNLIIRLGDEE